MLEDIVDVEMADGGDDLITRKEALKAALDWQVRPHEEVFNRIKAAIIARMQAVPKAEGWVSVKDRMPEKKCECLVAINSVGRVLRALDFWEGDGWAITCEEEITHWMPLPKPPEEEEKC